MSDDEYKALCIWRAVTAQEVINWTLDNHESIPLWAIICEHANVYRDKHVRILTRDYGMKMEDIGIVDYDAHVRTD